MLTRYSIRALLTAAAIVLAAFFGCSRPAVSHRPLILATTTSTQESGLLDVLLPLFREESNIEVKAVAVGSGQALELGRRGDADILLTHAPRSEQQFMAEGYGEQRTPVMYNDFVLVGPKADPAAIRGQKIVEALRHIAHTESRFVSRGDDSGTHMKEVQIWEAADVRPTSAWYIRAGAGMAATLRMANEKGAYTLSDRGTFLAQRTGLELVILSHGEPMLRNQYAAIVVSSQKHPHVQFQAARRFIEFLGSQKAQATIREFGVEKHGEPLFFVGDSSLPRGKE